MGLGSVWGAKPLKILISNMASLGTKILVQSLPSILESKKCHNHISGDEDENTTFCENRENMTIS